MSPYTRTCGAFTRERLPLVLIFHDSITNPTASILAGIAVGVFTRPLTDPPDSRTRSSRLSQNPETALCTSLVVTDVTTTTMLVALFLRLSNNAMKSERLIKRLVRARSGSFE